MIDPHDRLPPYLDGQLGKLSCYVDWTIKLSLLSNFAAFWERSVLFWVEAKSKISRVIIQNFRYLQILSYLLTYIKLLTPPTPLNESINEPMEHQEVVKQLK